MGVCVRTHTQAHTRGVEEGSMRGLGRERERWRQRKREEEEDTRDRSREGRKDREAEPPEGPGVQPRLPVQFRDVCQVRPPPKSPSPILRRQMRPQTQDPQTQSPGLER